MKSTNTNQLLYVRCFESPNFVSMMFDANDPNDGIIPTHYNTGNWDGFPNFSSINYQTYDNQMESIQILNYSGMEAEIQLFVDTNYSTSIANWTIYVRPSSESGPGDSNKDGTYRTTNIDHQGNFLIKLAYSTGTAWWYKKHHWDNKVSSMKWRLVECVGQCAEF